MSQFIPAIGAYIAGVLPVLVALLHSPRTGLFVLIVIVAYQQLENYFFSPRITAHTMEIHVALAFGSVIAGTALLGIVGAFLALPVAATAQAFISSWLSERTGIRGTCRVGRSHRIPRQRTLSRRQVDPMAGWPRLDRGRGGRVDPQGASAAATEPAKALWPEGNSGWEWSLLTDRNGAAVS